MDDYERQTALANTIDLEGKPHYTVRTFAFLTRRSEQSIRALVFKGNRLGILKAKKISNTLLIPATELVDFKFASVGRSDLVYRYTDKAEEYTEHIPS